MKIDNKYHVGQLVFLIHDPLQYDRMVKHILIGEKNVISYMLACGEDVTEHSEMEIHDECDVEKRNSNL
jgi:hypothetical protein